MAYKLTSGSLPEGAVQAHNKSHSDRSHAGCSHFDGPDWSSGSSPAEQTVDKTLVASGVTAAPTYGSTTGLTHALLIFEEVRRIHNLEHRLNHNSGAAVGVYPYAVSAHKAAEAASTEITTGSYPTMPTGSAAESALFSAMYPLANDLLNQYELGHRRDKKYSDGTTVDFHTTDDVINFLGTVTLLTGSNNKNDLAERANLLQRVIVAHLRKAGGTHSAADTARADVLEDITPAASGDDWDAIELVLEGCQVALDAHRADAGIHANADTFNDVTATITMPATLIGAGTLPRGILLLYMQHLTAVDDSGNPIHANVPGGAELLTYSNPTSIATLVAAAAELYVAQPAHQRSAPISQALRFLS